MQITLCWVVNFLAKYCIFFSLLAKRNSSCSGQNGNWNWTDGSRSIYTNWVKDGDDDDKTRHDCVYLDNKDGKWRDESCAKKLSFLCKMKSQGWFF